MTPATLGSRIGVAAAGVLLLSFGGVGAFALTGSLSAGQAGEVPVGAPTTGAAHGPAATPVADSDEDSDDKDSDDKDSEGTAKPSGAPTQAVGPDATGPAAFGLCTAWSHAKPSKQTATHSVAFRNLVAAAGGEDKVEAYCASVQHPSAGKAEKPSGKAGKPSGKPDKSSKHPTGKPTERPGRGGTGHPTGPPSSTPGTGTATPRG